MGEFTNALYSLVSRAASEQGGVISGDNPTKYSPSNPIRLWIIQLVIIISMTQLLSLILSRIRQPRVIAEVIGGVILGPTVMGRIPHFKETIFPEDSMPLLAVTSTIGLILFLFLVALEIDTRLLKRNILASASVSIAGLIIPLGLGAALGVGVYREFVDSPVNFGHFLLFIAVAIGITAFPVLCRILTELKLLDTEVGLVTLSAGIGNDVIGWILLALTVALVNASSGLTALWVLLVCAGYTVFLLYPGRWAFRWMARRTGSLEQGSPTPFMMTITLLVVFISAFFTDIIGVHAIFGGFLAGLIIPHDNGFAISIVEKIEDLVTILFLPIYFTLSGLRTNLGLLNNGVDWGYIVIICLVAFTSKFVACGGAARLTGFNWRESGAIGSLMSCKGLVELIVLNIGLQANILNTKTFSMFVVHALVLTFMTTPLVLLFYPARHRVHHRGDKVNESDEKPTSISGPPPDDHRKTRFAIVLDKFEALSAAMTLSQLFQAPESYSVAPLSSNLVGNVRANADDIQNVEAASQSNPSPSSNSTPISIEALRLMELTNRTSAVLRSQEASSLIYNDPVVSVYRTFGQLHNFNVMANLAVVNFDEFPETIAKHVADTSAQLVLIPWARGITSVLEDVAGEAGQQQGVAVGTRNPFDGIFHKTTTQDQTSSYVYSEYIRNVFAKSPCDIGLFVDRGVIGSGSGVVSNGTGKQHLFLPFFGGPDDRLALALVVQMCECPGVTAKVVKLSKTEAVPDTHTPGDEGHRDGSTAALVLPPLQHTVAAADTVYGAHTTQTLLSSNTADSILWDRFTRPESSEPRLTSLSRITFYVESTPTPLRRVTELAKEEAAKTFQRTLIVVAGRSRRLAVESLRDELQRLATGDGGNANGAATVASTSSSVPKTLGDVGAALVATNVNASLLILQAAPSTAA